MPAHSRRAATRSSPGSPVTAPEARDQHETERVELLVRDARAQDVEIARCEPGSGDVRAEGAEQHAEQHQRGTDREPAARERAQFHSVRPSRSYSSLNDGRAFMVLM